MNATAMWFSVAGGRVVVSIAPVAVGTYEVVEIAAMLKAIHAGEDIVAARSRTCRREVPPAAP